MTPPRLNHTSGIILRMCGVVGIYSYNPVSPEINRDELRIIRDYMSFRGPDGLGEWFSPDGRVALGHRRLSIIDLSDAGSQPMSNEDQTIWLTFNGEIYNYRELRYRLSEGGRTFRSQSDSEVIIRLYEEKGESMLQDLRGMFAFALWDAKQQRMLLARDPYGIKPLYYADDGWCLRVASQVKALQAGHRVSRDIEPAGLAGFYLTGSVPEPFTVYREIRSLPAGSFLWVSSIGPSAPREYFSIARVFAESRCNTPPVPEKDFILRAANVLKDSIKYHFVSDVPVGCFLSSGIDSGLVVALSSDLGIENLQTLTLAFQEYRGSDQDETELASQVARQYRASHTTRVLTESEFAAEMPRVFEAMDQPSIDGANTYFVAKAAAEAGLKVALSGLGGDELFGSYPSFHDIPSMVKVFALPGLIPGLGPMVRAATSALMGPGLSPKLAGLVQYGGSYPGAYLLRRGLFMPWELKTILGKELAAEGLKRLSILKLIRKTLDSDPGTSHLRVSALESSLYMRNQLLRDADWASMAHSVEVRVPFVDSVLIRNLAPLLATAPGRLTKQRLASGITRALPAGVISHRKTGFTIPVDRWIERSKDLDAWRSVPELAKPGVHWARRLAFSTASALLPH